MKIDKIVIILLALSFKISLSQTTEGKITYQVSLNNKTYIDELKQDDKLSERTKKVKIRDAEKAYELNFFLFFKEKESLYHSEFDMDMKKDLGMKMNDTGILAADDETTYYNLKTKEFFSQSFWYDQILVEPEPLKWKLTQETKKIGEYTCYKASATLIEDSEKGGYQSEGIIAWYTLQIPVPFGIWKFGGLPGLTLELTHKTDEGTLLYKATKIELNPKDKVSIKKPKGKLISHKKFIEFIRNANKNRSMNR